MKRSTNLTFVNLKSLPEKGEQYQFSQQNGELDEQLRDLIGSNNYYVSLEVRPVGNVFEISGEIRAEMDLICSHCGRELHHPVNDSFNELIVVTAKWTRAGHSGHVNSVKDHEITCNYATSFDFDLGDFVHEHIALAEPDHPLCARPDCDDVFNAANRTVKNPIDFNPLLRDNSSIKK